MTGMHVKGNAFMSYIETTSEWYWCSDMQGALV